MASYGIKERPPTWILDDDIPEKEDDTDGSTSASQNETKQCSQIDDQQEGQVDMFPDMIPTSPSRVMSTYGVTSITSASKAASAANPLGKQRQTQAKMLKIYKQPYA